jgi:hypothetical protein
LEFHDAGVRAGLQQVERAAFGKDVFRSRSAQGRSADRVGYGHAAVYENLLLDPGLRALIGRFYGALDLRTSTQTWLREITPELIRAIGS